MKNLLIAIVFITASLSAFSQVKVNPGLRLGLNSSTVTNHYESERVLGLNAAIFANFNFTSFYQLQPELTYSSQGYNGTQSYYDDAFRPVIMFMNEKAELDYLGFAVANKFFFIPDLGFHFVVGPSLEFNISNNAYNEITQIDFSVFGGIGYEFSMGLGFEVRYKQGLMDVRDGYYDYYFDGYDTHINEKIKLNSVFQFNVYYKFNFSN